MLGGKMIDEVSLPSASGLRSLAQAGCASAFAALALMGSVNTAMAQSGEKGAAQKTPPNQSQSQNQNQKQAPVDAEPQSTTATFGDWTLQCRRNGTGATAQKSCEVVQSVTAQGQQAPLAQIAIGRTGPSEPLTVTLVLPHNVSFPSTPRLGLKTGAAGLDLAWARCLPVGCFANARLTDEALRQWRTAADPQGQIQSTDAAGRKFELAASFRGLAQALDAMQK
jgi:invasion protein IalB